MSQLCPIKVAGILICLTDPKHEWSRHECCSKGSESLNSLISQIESLPHRWLIQIFVDIFSPRGALRLSGMKFLTLATISKTQNGKYLTSCWLFVHWPISMCFPPLHQSVQSRKISEMYWQLSRFQRDIRWLSLLQSLICLAVMVKRIGATL